MRCIRANFDCLLRLVCYLVIGNRGRTVRQIVAICTSTGKIHLFSVNGFFFKIMLFPEHVILQIDGTVIDSL